MKSTGKHVIDDESQTDVCSLLFINTYKTKKAFFPSVNRRAASRVKGNAEENEGVVENAQKIHALYMKNACSP